MFFIFHPRLLRYSVSLTLLFVDSITPPSPLYRFVRVCSFSNVFFFFFFIFLSCLLQFMCKFIPMKLSSLNLRLSSLIQASKLCSCNGIYSILRKEVKITCSILSFPRLKIDAIQCGQASFIQFLFSFFFSFKTLYRVIQWRLWTENVCAAAMIKCVETKLKGITFLLFLFFFLSFYWLFNKHIIGLVIFNMPVYTMYTLNVRSCSLISMLHNRHHDWNCADMCFTVQL